MGRHLLRAPNGVIVEWSSIVDAPTQAFKDEAAARTITVVEASVEALHAAHRDWEPRARRLREHGTTMMDRGDGWESCVGYNRAGPGEKRLGEKKLLALVTNMAEENEAGSAAWLAQNDPKEATKAERARIVALAREMAAGHDRAWDRCDDGTTARKHAAARDALMELVKRVEGG